jgi:hypothetical protein
MSNASCCLGIALSLALSTSAAIAASKSYFNENYGFGVRLPGGYMLEDRAERSDEGTTLRSPDGKAVINVFGSANTARKSIGELVEDYKLNAPNATFTYEWRRGNAAVLSGYEGGDIFYVRIELSDDRRRVALLSMTYARDVKRRLDPIVTQLSRSLYIE